MYIAGFVKLSTIDYPSFLSCVVFTQGCNLNCFFCHNRDIIDCSCMKEIVPESEVLSFVDKRSSFLEAMVISGGEPCLQKDLKDFIIRVRNIKKDIKIKLDTNGTCPKVLKDLLDEKLVDYVAMDYKAPWDMYETVCGKGTRVDNIKESMNILNSSSVEWELRTTLIPGLTLKDYKRMSDEIEVKTSRYRFNKYRPVEYAKNMKMSLPIEEDLIPVLCSNYKKFSDNVIING